MPEAPLSDVFLSYNRRDQPAVRKLFLALQARGLSVWFDEALTPGTLWMREIERGLANARCVAVCLGEHGFGDWEQAELRQAAEQAVKAGRPVVPVLLPGAPADATWPFPLNQFTHCDLRRGLRKASLENLVRGIEKARQIAASSAGATASAAEALGPPRRHNLPFDSLGSLFQGREAELAQLARDLAQGPAVIGQRSKAAILGLGGIGKTRLAVEYAWQYGARYNAVLFLRADSPAALSANLAGLAQLPWIALPVEPGSAQEGVVEAMLRWLYEHSGWLLILDNIDDAEAARAVRDLLPYLSAGRVLLTSRWSSWPPAMGRADLETLPASEAAQFLLDYTATRRFRNDDDPAVANRLAEALGGLPLALEQGAAYINKYHLTLAAYSQAWQEEREKVLAWYDEAVMQYPKPVAVTWQRSFERLGPAGIALLRLASFLAPHPIPVALFEGRDLFADTPVREALAELEELSLVTQGGEAFTIHRMVQEVVRGRARAEERPGWLERLLKILQEFAPVPPDDVRTWPVWEPLRPHVTRAVERAEEIGIPARASFLMNQLAVLLLAKGLYGEAEPLLRRALAIDEASFGPNHPRVAIDLNDLGQLLKDTNRLREAEPLLRRALAIDEASFGQDHTTVAIDLNNLGQLLKWTNRLGEAEPLMRRALAIDEASFGPDHTDVARDLNNLGRLLQATNRLGEAEQLLRRALAIDETSFGPDHPRVAIDLNNLGQLLQATNRLGEAEPLIKRTLAIDEASFGSDHPTVAIDLNNLGRLLQDMRRLSEAEPLMRRALAILEQSLGPDHPHAQIARRNLEVLLATQSP